MVEKAGEKQDGSNQLNKEQTREIEMRSRKEQEALIEKLRADLAKEIKVNMSAIENKVTEMKIDQSKLKGQDKQTELEQKRFEERLKQM